MVASLLAVDVSCRILFNGFFPAVIFDETEHFPISAQCTNVVAIETANVWREPNFSNQAFLFGAIPIGVQILDDSTFVQSRICPCASKRSAVSVL